MRPLTASDMLLIWDQGQAQTPLARALTTLAVASPETTPEQLASLTLGQRDNLLFSLRQQTFGAALAGYSECPNCAERLEFSFNVEDVLTNTPFSTVRASSSALTFEYAGYQVGFHLPDSRDMAEIATYQDVEAARQALIRRCIMEITPPIEELPQEMIARLSEEIIRRDPLADIALDLACPACGHRWQVTFDIGAFLWAEVNNQAKRLMREVYTLAKAYGWSEQDILALSATRRQAYLELAS